MTEQELTIHLEDCRREEAERQTAGDGRVYSMDEVLREVMAAYQPLAATQSVAPQLVAC